MNNRQQPFPKEAGAAERRPKVLYAASTESHLRRFHMPYIRALQETCDVHLMAKGDGVDHPIGFEKSMTSPANLRAIRQIRAVLKRESFDAVILNTSLAAFLIRAAMLGMKHRPKVLNIVHGYLFSYPPQGKKDRMLLQCEKLMKKKTDEIAVMNQADAELLRACRLCLGKTHALRGMGYVMPQAQPTPDKALRAVYAGSQEKLLCFVGELSVRKNQAFLIRSLAALRREGLPLKLLLLGEGDARAELEGLAKQEGVSEQVFLVGNREPVFPYLAISDLYVSASKSEGLPFNLMEAMACGLPVVASATNGQTDLLEPVPECMYPLQDEAAFCAAVQAALRGKLGIGATCYPWLQQYELSAVQQENLDLMRGFIYDRSNQN